MDQADLFLVFTGPLDQAGINYMITGSVGSMVYGIPRFTHDVDLVIELPLQKIEDMVMVFPLSEFYCPPAEILKVESHRPRRGHFNVIHHESGFKADMYVHRDDELQAWGLENKRRIDLTQASRIWVAPPEYLIVRKLEYYREGRSEKHLGDIRGMLEVSGDGINMDVIADWTGRLGMQDLFELISRPE